MNDIIRVNGNELNVNGKIIKFDYEIRETKLVDSQVMVLLSIPFNVNEVDNIYAVSLEGKINWRVESLNLMDPNGNNMPYENMFLDKEALTATDFYGRRYFINIMDGTIIKKDIVK